MRFAFSTLECFNKKGNGNKAVSSGVTNTMLYFFETVHGGDGNTRKRPVASASLLGPPKIIIAGLPAKRPTINLCEGTFCTRREIIAACRKRSSPLSSNFAYKSKTDRAKTAGRARTRNCHRVFVDRDYTVYLRDYFVGGEYINCFSGRKSNAGKSRL